MPKENVVSTMQGMFRDDFRGTVLSGMWQVLAQGSGQNISVSGGELLVTGGTVANAETVIRSVQAFTVPFRVWFIGRLSQRIANQEFYLEVTNAAGDMLAQWMFDGTSATQAKFNAVNAGTGAMSGVAGVNTTASDSILELQVFPDEVWYANRIVDSSLAKGYAYVRHRNVPDPNQEYFIQIRVKNLGTAPGSNTTLYLGAVCAQDVTELVAEMTGGQGDNVGSRGIAANLTASTNFIGDVAQGVRNTATNAMLQTRITFAAGTNGINIKNASARVYGWRIANISAAWRYVKLYNKASAPTVGTDTPVDTIAIPPGGEAAYFCPHGVYYSAGVGYGTTTGHADTDVGGVTAGDLVGSIFYYG